MNAKTSDKAPNFSTAQEQLIRDTAAANGGTLNLALVKTLAADAAMNTADGEPRNYRSIVAKVSLMTRSGEPFSYERKQPTTKDGKPVTKKTDLVADIARLTGVAVAKLDGMDKSPKLALESIVAALEAREDADDDEATGTDG